MSLKPSMNCPHCGYRDTVFHAVCPECGRPYVRDYIDTQVHPRDPDPAGICTRRLWARIFLMLVVAGIIAGLLFTFGILP
ncbi:MAG: hypothetical protein LUQ71_08910 [Methanoregula sp.]|nr:hypothetical protein [Methanoregula sp.]